MGLRTWYENNIVPRIVGCGCGSEEVAELRRQVVPLAEGRVLEIGVGGGFNQVHYDTAKVTSFAGIDPNPTLLDQARDRAKGNGWDAEIRQGKAESIPFPDRSFDTVVCTYTLCSVDNQAKALAEMRRVLASSGRLLFLEHGRAPDAAQQKWQQRIEPVWKRAMGNCHLSREIGSALRKAGFEVEPIGQAYFDGMPKWAGWMEWGSARRAGV